MLCTVAVRYPAPGDMQHVYLSHGKLSEAFYLDYSSVDPGGVRVSHFSRFVYHCSTSKNREFRKSEARPRVHVQYPVSACGGGCTDHVQSASLASGRRLNVTRREHRRARPLTN